MHSILLLPSLRANAVGVIRSVVSVGLSVCNALTLESFHLERSFLVRGYVFRKHSSSLYIKVIESRSRSRRQLESVVIEKALQLEGRNTPVHMGIVMKAHDDASDVGWPSSCNAFAIATLSSYYCYCICVDDSAGREQLDVCREHLLYSDEGRV